MASRYCVDASAIIHAWRDLYRPKSFPTFWSRVDELIDGGGLIAPEDVREELRSPKDLVDWADARDKTFRDLDEELQQALRNVLSDLAAVMGQRKLPFLAKDLKADPVVVALARLTGSTVVTQERPRGLQGRPKIPDLCHRYGIKCIGIADLIDEQAWRF